MAGVYTVHAHSLLKFLLSLTNGDRAEAEDLLQETMLRVWQSIDRLPTSVDGRQRWLYTVARHVGVDAFRRRRARPQEVELQAATGLASGDDTMESVLATHSLRRALDELTSQQRAILADLYVDGRHVQQIAVLHGIPLGTVKSRAYYARLALAKAMAG
jgi:RNA polymerase sigma-70 factor (ECF subfamily)